MDDFRLRVFHSVATNLSFTKAANELFITQPAVTQHIKELEKRYNTRLFDRKGSRIALTLDGAALLRYAETVLNLHRQLERELQTTQTTLAGRLRIGASTTIAQYVLPPVIARFYQRYPNVRISLVSENTKQIADALLKGRIDIGLVEGHINRRDLKQEQFMEDELLAIVSPRSEFAHPNEILAENLALLPIVLREGGSGTLEILEQALESKGIDVASLNVVMSLGSTESIKSFVEAGYGIGFVSQYAVKKERMLGTLTTLTIKNLRLKRSFYFIYLQGPKPSGLIGTFMEFAQKSAL